MCIIVDTNALASVFKHKSSDHSDFAPVARWITDGKGALVYGGSKYISELREYLNLFNEFRKAQKAIRLNDGDVDLKQKWVSKQLKHRDFDDPHIVAILLESGCKLVCTKDVSAIPFLKHVKFFPKRADQPKIYSRRRHAPLLTDKYIAQICKPCKTLNLSQKKKLKLK